MKFSEKVGNGPLDKWLHFSGDPDHRLGTGIVFRIHSSLLGDTESVNGHKSAVLPDGGTGKTCVGGGVQRTVLSASSFCYFSVTVD